MKTCLVICRNPSGLASLKRIKSKFPIIVASDDPRVHEECKKFKWVLDVTFIEKMESFFIVADDVKNIINVIDKWLYSLNPKIPKEIMTWGTQIEGGIINQRVQDTLLLIRSYFYLLSSFNVKEVHVIEQAGFEWEDDVLRECCKAKALCFKSHVSDRFGTCISALKRALIPYAKAGYLLIHEILNGGGRIRAQKPSINLDGVVIFQLCSSLEKHVDNIKYLMLSLNKLGEKSVGLCWSAGGRIIKPTGHEQLLSSGIMSIALEKFVTLNHIFSSLFKAAAISVKGRKRYKKLMTLSYEGVLLAPLLKESFRNFFIVELPRRVRYASALNACLSNASPVAIKPWGGIDFFEGRLALRLLSNHKKPLYLHYWVGAAIPDWPYTDKTYKPDIFFAKSPFEAELAMQEYEIEESKVEIVGQARFDKLHLFASLNKVEDSRYYLNLPLNGKFYIGVDPGDTLRGYQSYREQLEKIISILRVAESKSDLVIAVKAHPSYGIEHLIPIISTYNKNKNIFVLQKSAPIEHFLNAIDILVTKYSTLILEAALLGRCSIAAILDGEERFKVFGDLPYIVKSAKELKSLITQLASDTKFFNKWKTAQLIRCQKLIPKYYFDGRNVASLASERIITELNHYETAQ